MIPICQVQFEQQDLDAVVRVLQSGWIVQGKEVAAFEESVSDYCGVSHGVATTSGTTALHLAVRALDLKPGDEVIVPAFTWVATANVIEHCGATPVFCDIELSTFNIDVEQIESLITDRTVGLLPVHLFGLCADMPRLREIADRHGLWIIEDAACALGSRYGNFSPGQLSDAAMFSFHPRKSITTGEGGMVVTNCNDLAERCRALRNHGAGVSDHQRHDSRMGFLLSEFAEFGFNYRMTDIQAALGNSQMARFDEILGERRRLAARYDELLADIDGIQAPIRPDDMQHSYQSYVCLFAPYEPTIDNLDALEQQRNELLLRLQDRSIVTRQGTHAPVRQKCYREKYGFGPESFPNAWLAESLSIALPLFPGLSDKDQQTVVDELRAGLLATKQFTPLRGQQSA